MSTQGISPAISTDTLSKSMPKDSLVRPAPSPQKNLVFAGDFSERVIGETVTNQKDLIKKVMRFPEKVFVTFLDGNKIALNLPRNYTSNDILEAVIQDEKLSSQSLSRDDLFVSLQGKSYEYQEGAELPSIKNIVNKSTAVLIVQK